MARQRRSKRKRKRKRKCEKKERRRSMRRRRRRKTSTEREKWKDRESAIENAMKYKERFFQTRNLRDGGGGIEINQREGVEKESVIEVVEDPPSHALETEMPS